MIKFKKYKKQLSTTQISIITEGVRRGLIGRVIAECAGCSQAAVHKYKPHGLGDFRRGWTTESCVLVGRLKARYLRVAG